MPDDGSFTGRRRSRSLSAGVRQTDRLARLTITVGGFGTIAAVVLICLFLLWVAAPLFGGAAIDEASAFPREEGDGSAASESILRVGMDDFLRLCWILRADGRLDLLRADDGSSIERRRLFEDETPTAAAIDSGTGRLVFAFADGTVRLGTIGVSSEVLQLGGEGSASEVNGSTFDADGFAVRDGVFYERLSDRLYRSTRLEVELGEPVDVSPGVPILLVDSTEGLTGMLVGALAANGTLVISSLRERTNWLTGETVTDVDRTELAFVPLPDAAPPSRLLLDAIGDTLLLSWPDGRLQRYDARLGSEPGLAETLTVAEGNDRLGGIEYLLGKTTVVAGDEGGVLHVWFTIRPDESTTRDGRLLVEARRLGVGGGAISALAPSARSRVLGVGRENGRVELFHVTSGKLLAAVSVEGEEPIRALSFAPRENALLALTDSSVHTWQVDPGYPEASLSALFGRVWYEGYQKPEHVWQSTGMTDDFEPKLGLVPLIFGTLKATLYSLLFGAPLALLAAIYTSEFLDPKLRSPIKSTIEVMAGLPSVVLGFLAALVIAPAVQDALGFALLTFFLVPLALLFGARLFQLLPPPLLVRLGGKPRILLALLPIAAGLGLAALLGSTFERVLFAGDVAAWLTGEVGSATGGWVFLLLPVWGLVVLWGAARFTGVWLRQLASRWSPLRTAAAEGGVFLASMAVALGLAVVTAKGLDIAGFDPRGEGLGFFSPVGTYVQRNALIVGFVMGFAIIPIIYTLAEDALTSVPAHLRFASLATGATSWQTAARVIVPAAMSGLFSALMIGLGRAVGETMIVLMATGNTPILDLNIFNGFRTLSANIAVELPEAVVGSTHYRTLFLAALTLFAMTFVVNSAAEIVRQRFRKRTYQL